MHKTIRALAVYFAVMIFFIMAIVGWFAGCAPATCCSRALTGAVITYLTISYAAAAVYKILLKEMINHRIQKTQK